MCSLLIPPKRFDIFPPITGGCSEGLAKVCSDFSLNEQYYPDSIIKYMNLHGIYKHNNIIVEYVDNVSIHQAHFCHYYHTHTHVEIVPSYI